MAGIYIHIPFCKRACHYCNFHFSTSLRQKEALLLALNKEITSTPKPFDEIIETIYFGGGTPSTLTSTELATILSSVSSAYTVSAEVEICFEANPDDLDQAYIEQLVQNGVNRLSIGVQSFHDADLVEMNRAHNADQAKACILAAQKAGITNLSIDLIYGANTTSDQMWAENLQMAQSLNIPHISAYALTVEHGTPLDHYIQNGKIAPLDDQRMVRQFKCLRSWAADNDFHHYEISNLARPGFESKHNSSYWDLKPYIGFGPSAHSFYNKQRHWNIANNREYIAAINEGRSCRNSEDIDPTTLLNDYILTNLRRSKGLLLEELKKLALEDAWVELQEIASAQNPTQLHITEQCIRLSDAGMLMADHLSMQLLKVD